MILRMAVALIMALGIVACAPRDIVRYSSDVPSTYKGVFSGDAEAVVAAVDWSKATNVTLRIRQADFDPILLRFRRGQPYVLTIENADDASYGIKAVDFFEAIAVKSLTPSDIDITPNSALVSIALEPLQTRELSFVPVRDGDYTFENGSPGLYLLGGHFAPFSRGTFGVGGSVTIE